VNRIGANLLFYAIHREAPQHERTRQGLEAQLSGSEPVGFAWVVLLAVLRIALERGATLASCDNDFCRFGGLRLLDPLAEGRG